MIAVTEETYRLRTPSQAARELAADPPGGRAAADELVRAYLAEATARHGVPDEGWWLDADDLAEIRARHAADHEHREALAQAGEATAVRDATSVDAQAGGCGDRERVLDEGPGSLAGGMRFTPDAAAPGGVRPLTATELREITDRVRATRAEAIAQDLDPPTGGRQSGRVDGAVDGAEWER